MTTESREIVLSEITTLYDSLHKTPKYLDQGYPMIRVTDIKYGCINLSNTQKVSEEVYREFTKKYHPRKGDIIFSRVGSYGNSSFVKYDQQFCLGQNTVCISPSCHKVDPFYLYLCLNSYSVKRQIDSFVGGSSQPTISLQNIKKLKISLPCLTTQRKIAGILSAYDDLIENNTRRIEILEEMAQTLYREWFVKFRFSGYENVRFVESELGLIPEGWGVGRLDDALVLQRGFDLPKKLRKTGNVPIYAATGIVDNHNEVKVKAPCVITGRSGSLGTVMYIDEDF
jgi:type I restriction enzyme S subunit